MTHLIRADEKIKINLAPATIEDEVKQNIRMILLTPQYSVPLNRAFGMPQRFIDKPLPVAKTLLIAEIMDAIEAYEPRATVNKITFDEDAQDGRLSPILEVDINANA
ncbi:hypothetical protein FACS18949_02850 [Clostridia bacterium]|nr:hypothetical protein FACS18949_02850 [Clostridia bacterium]